MGQKTKGYILASVAACTYGMNPLFALPLYDAGMSPDSVLFFRYLIAIPIIGAMIAARGRSFRIGLRATASLAVLGLLMAFSSLALFLSYNYMDAGIASTMLFVYPIMVAVIMTAVFREKLTPETAGCIALALTGIFMLYKGDGAGSASLSLTGTQLVMASALSYAIYIVAVNRAGLKKVPTLVVTFYVLLFGLSLFAVRLFANGAVETPPADRWWLWGSVVALAVFPTAVSFICTTRAIQLIGSTPTAILGALEPLTAVFFGVAVFGERLTMRDVAGFILIVVAVSGVVASPVIHPRLNRLRRMFPRIRRRKWPLRTHLPLRK